jgi:hypothetical protein
MERTLLVWVGTEPLLGALSVSLPSPLGQVRGGGRLAAHPGRSDL